MTETSNPIDQRWFAIGKPWAADEQCDLDILCGSPDPHQGTYVLGAGVWAGEDGHLTEQQTREVVRYIVSLHNHRLSDRPDTTARDELLDAGAALAQAARHIHDLGPGGLIQPNCRADLREALEDWERAFAEHDPGAAVAAEATA
jgi:hypothetical protein